MSRRTLVDVHEAFLYRYNTGLVLRPTAGISVRRFVSALSDNWWQAGMAGIPHTALYVSLQSYVGKNCTSLD